MTKFQKLLRELSELKLDTTRMALEREAREERDALLEISRHPRVTATLRTKAQNTAEGFYADEICERLEGHNPPITPAQVLGHRRTPAAWAVATKIIEARTALLAAKKKKGG